MTDRISQIWDASNAIIEELGARDVDEALKILRARVNEGKAEC